MHLSAIVYQVQVVLLTHGTLFKQSTGFLLLTEGNHCRITVVMGKKYDQNTPLSQAKNKKYAEEET